LGCFHPERAWLIDAPALHGAYLGREHSEVRRRHDLLVSSTESDKETNHVNRQASSVVRLASALLIAGIVAVACGRSSGGQGALQSGTDPAAAASPVAASLNPAPSAVTPEDLTAPGASDSTAPGASYAPPATANDPVTGEIQSIDQLLKSIDGSLSGADPGTAGGE
jgi:hypothetical protein